MTDWPGLLAAGAGGFLGAAARFLVGGAAQRAAGGSFPVGTLLVNVVGCAAIGVVMGLAEGRGGLSEGTRAFLVVGVLGGFTTYSAFGFDTVRLWQAGAAGMALFNVALQIVLGIGAAAVGFALTRGS